MKKIMTKALSVLLVILVFISCFSITKISIRAAFNRSTDVTYSYSTKVTVGKIRFIAQTNSSREVFSDYFYPKYWYDGDARWGCFVASTSMALSYMGVNMTPKVLREKGLVFDGNYMAASSTVASKVTSDTDIAITSLFANATQTSFSTLDKAIKNFRNGNGMYSPPIVWTKGADGGSHYFLVTEKLSENLYEMVDPICENNQKVNLVSYSTNIIYGNNGTAKGRLSDIIQYKRDTALPKPATYTITYNANGGTGAPSSQTKTHGSTLKLSSAEPIRPGCKFLGWAVDNSAQTAEYCAGALFDIDSDTTLYAVWKEIHEHFYSDKVTLKPTCAQTGERTFTCSCGDSYIEPIPTTEHNVIWVTDVPATVDSSGSKHGKCTVCGKIFETETIPQIKPATPEFSNIENTTNGVRVIWDAVSGADNYVVYRRIYDLNAKKWGGWSIIARGVKSTSYVDETVKSGTYYIYTVKAHNEAGYSGYPSGIKIYFLATPKLSGAANAVGGVKVVWNKIGGAREYTLYRRAYDADAGKWGGWTNIANGVRSTTYVDETVKSGHFYIYTVRANNNAFRSAYVSGLKVYYLTAPTLSTVTSSKSGVTLGWGRVQGATVYNVYRKTNGGNWRRIASVSGNAKISYLDKTTEKGTTYTYTVKAYRGNYKSAHNNNGITIKDKY